MQERRRRTDITEKGADTVVNFATRVLRGLGNALEETDAPSMLAPKKKAPETPPGNAQR